jgi:indole-3-glycerol phosphate synthase
LDDARLKELIEAARRLHLDALVEAHDAGEVRRAAVAGADVIGVNSRDLRTLAVSTDVFERVLDAFPANAIAVAESGINRPQDVVRLRELGYHACLIGERFMQTPSPGQALREFLAAVVEVGS